MELRTIGIDLGKTVFHLVGLNLHGEVVVRKKCSRKQLLHFTANLKVRLIGMEACGGSHFLGRALREQGHEVRLIPAQYVKPYVKTNKSDYIDAEAIDGAVGRPRMRFVPIKTDDQLDLQSLHRVRERWVMRARAVLQQSAKQSSGLSAWLAQLTARTHRNVAAVALANKLARMAWAVLARNEPYRPPMLAGCSYNLIGRQMTPD